MKQFVFIILLFCAMGIVLWVRNVAHDGAPGSLAAMFTPAEIDEGSSYDAASGLFTSPKSKFSVVLPSPPKDDHRYHLSFTNTTGCVSVDSQEISYFVGRPVRVVYIGGRPDMNSLVDSGTKGLVEILHGTELHRSPVTLGGHPFIGRDSQGSLSGGRCYRLRFFVNTVTYSEFLLVAVGSREKMLSVSTQKFFESFKVSEEPTR